MLLYLYLIIGMLMCLFSFKAVLAHKPDVLSGFNTPTATIIFKILICATVILYWPLILLIMLTNDNEKNS